MDETARNYVATFGFPDESEQEGTDGDDREDHARSYNRCHIINVAELFKSKET